MKLRVRFEPDEREWVTAYCPDLPGCLSQGKGVDEAKANIAEAIEGFLEVLLEDAVAENLKHYLERVEDATHASDNVQVVVDVRVETTA